MQPSRPTPDPRRALDRANQRIRAYVQGLPRYVDWTTEQRARYDELLDQFNAAREAARAREAEDGPEPVAA